MPKAPRTNLDLLHASLSRLPREAVPQSSQPPQTGPIGLTLQVGPAQAGLPSTCLLCPWPRRAPFSTCTVLTAMGMPVRDGRTWRQRALFPASGRQLLACPPPAGLVASPDVPPSPPIQVKSGLQVNQKGLWRLGKFFTIPPLTPSLWGLKRARGELLTG